MHQSILNLRFRLFDRLPKIVLVLFSSLCAHSAIAVNLGEQAWGSGYAFYGSSQDQNVYIPSGPIEQVCSQIFAYTGSLPSCSKIGYNGLPETCSKGFGVAKAEGGTWLCAPNNPVSSTEGYYTKAYCPGTSWMRTETRGDKIYCVEAFGFKLRVGFFNGVFNTEFAATQSLDRLRREYSNRLEYQSAGKTGQSVVDYSLFYNHTNCGVILDGCLLDISEVFSQRATEFGGLLGDHWELFWDLISGSHQAPQSLFQAIHNAIPSAWNQLGPLRDSLSNAIIAKVISYTVASQSNTASIDTSNHIAKINQFLDQDDRVVVVAHSQGNLFANAAYDALKKTRPVNSVSIVHVAPASPTLRGDYVLVDIDKVINALQATTSNTNIPANISIPESDKDATGHLFIATYMDRARGAYSLVTSKIHDKLLLQAGVTN